MNGFTRSAASKWKPYPKYKDSGVEWIGKVPEHWEVQRLKNSLISCKNGIWGDDARQDDNDIPCVRVADFDRQRLRVALNQPTIRNLPEKDRIDRTLSRNDLLIEKSGGGETQPVGCVVLYDDPRPAICSNFIARIQIAAGMDSSFWRYVHAAAYSIRLTVGSINQTSGIQNLDQSRYFDERVVFPTSEEQTTIAIFLDRETSKLDTLIAKQERLIELLQVKRKALISHAVTKGLDPNVKMKDSGVEWLGEVPEEWDILPLKRTTQIQLSNVDKHTVIGEQSVKLCNYLDVYKSDRITADIEFMVASASEEQIRRLTLQQGDVIITKDSETPDDIGVPAFVADNMDGVVCGYHLALLRAYPSIASGNFLASLMQSSYVRTKFATFAVGLTRYGLGKYGIENLVIPIPPIAEQSTITSFLDRETAKIDILIEKSRRSIELLQERRKALISAAVTGKIDVREESA
ncbi:MAG: restriction endonuclease subunit S [bacterium]